MHQISVDRQEEEGDEEEEEEDNAPTKMVAGRLVKIESPPGSRPTTPNASASDTEGGKRKSKKDSTS